MCITNEFHEIQNLKNGKATKGHYGKVSGSTLKRNTDANEHG